MGNPDARGGPSAHGAMLGKALARIADAGAEVIRRSGNCPPEPCRCCAFREGTMPNMAAQTVSDALSCLLTDSEFGCHHGLDESGEPTRRCAGYIRATFAPFDQMKAAIGDANQEMASIVDGVLDPVRADYQAWLETADPENALDDYQRAALWERRHA